MTVHSLTIALLKVIGSHLILFHHYMLYAGPSSDAMGPLETWLLNDAKQVVQIFLVMGGYLATASALSQHATDTRTRFTHVIPVVVQALAQRYARLAPIYLVAGTTVLVLTWVFSNQLPPEEIAQITITAVAANLFMLQDILGYPALSAGFWYVAIDLQLFAATAFLVFSGSRIRSQRIAGFSILSATVLATMLSLYKLNLDTNLDVYFPYFLGAYGLGSLAYLLTRGTHQNAPLAVAAVLGIGALALWIDWRSRIALATSVACLLCFRHQLDLRLRAWLPPQLGAGLQRVAQVSYPLFLMHYAVLMVFVVNWPTLPTASTSETCLRVTTCWIASLATAFCVHSAMNSVRRFAHRRPNLDCTSHA